MTTVDASHKDQFFSDVEAAAKKAIWCALATARENEPRVRMVHPTWEGDILWVATGPETAKAREIQANGAVDVQFQVAPDDFIHLMVRGQATVLTDQATKDRIWDVMDYDLAQFWPDGASSAEYCVIRIEPTRVELSEMFGTMNKRVWQA
jgi:general stress protein 26